MATSIKNHHNQQLTLKKKAIQLRHAGLSYTEILRKIPVSKSTISLWVRDTALTKEQQKRLSLKRDSQQRGLRSIHKNFWSKRCAAFNAGLAIFKKLDNNPDFIAGLMLYWAEGTKKKHAIITNSDKNMIKFMVVWFKKFFDIEPKELTASLNLHSGQNEKNMIDFWRKITGIPYSNFQKSFIKPEGTGHRKNILYNGTIKIRVRGGGSTYLLFKILGCLAGYLEQTIHEKAVPENWMQKTLYAE